MRRTIQKQRLRIQHDPIPTRSNNRSDFSRRFKSSKLKETLVLLDGFTD